jgi:membrane-associated phospholipid phosphatase
MDLRASPKNQGLSSCAKLATGMGRYTFVDCASQAYSGVAAILILLFHNQTVPAWPWLVAAHALGLVAVHRLVQPHAPGRWARALGFLRHFYPVLLYLWFFCETGWVNRMFFPVFLDPTVSRWEQSLFGCQPGVVFMGKLPWLAVSETLYAAYFSYYLMIAGVGLALFLRNRRQFFHYLSVVSFLFYVCYLIYIFVPVIGPRLFFGPVGGYSLPEEVRRLAPGDAYPAAVQRGVFFTLMGWIYQVFEAPGSSLPSSHVAVAWCTVHFSFRYLKPVRYAHLVLASLLTLSTIYCHYHYAVDVLAGLLAFALLVPLGNWLYFKFGAQPSEPVETFHQ